MCPNTNDMITFVLLPITNYSSSNHYKYFFFHFISGIVAEEDVYKSDLPDHVLDQQPTIQELTKHASTTDWNRLGVELKLDSVGSSWV